MKPKNMIIIVFSSCMTV